MRKSAIACFLFLASLNVHARELHWRELAVRAELAGDGSLHVVERQAMVFTGDWNGGERIFRVEPHQTLTLNSVKRIDANGVAHDLAEGNLDSVDQYAWHDEKTLRWRSRATSDAEFDQTEIVYLLKYTLSGILVPDLGGDGNSYTLDHDFAFSDRPGRIENYSLELTLGSDWSSPFGRVIRRRAHNLVPEEGFVVTVPLTFHGAAQPAAMSLWMAAGNRAKPWMAAGAMMLAFLIFLVVVLAHLAKIVTDEAPIDEAWLQRNVFRMTPEVAGTFLHGTVGAAEFAALLARLEQEKQIRTWTTTKRGAPNLHLELLVPIHDLDAPGQALAAKLFGSKTVTSTEQIREKYKHTGFDPPATIRPSVLMQAQQVAFFDDQPAPKWPGILLIVAGIAFGVYATKQVNSSIFSIMAVVTGSIVLFGLGYQAARMWGRKQWIAGLVMLGLLPLFGLVVWFASEQGIALTLYGTIAVTLGWLGAYLLVLGEARDPMTIEAAGVRKTMRRARTWFRRELKNPKPALRDEWTPWLIACGLHRSIGSWWRAYGGDTPATSGTSAMTTTSSSSSSSTSSSSASSAFTGGGGSFGGAGATGTWGTAAMALAAPVYSPASSSGGGYSSGGSSSSSGGGGGSSSGGGGGGGW